jgi:hypothetical protein
VEEALVGRGILYDKATKLHTLFRQDSNYTKTELGIAVSLRTREDEFWSDEKERVLGVLIHDIPDNDWTGMVLARNEHDRFRAVDPTLMSSDRGAASSALQKRVSESRSAQ